MADINQVITLGIGTPADIPHFVLVGLSPNASVLPVTGTIDGASGPAVGTLSGTVAHFGATTNAFAGRPTRRVDEDVAPDLATVHVEFSAEAPAPRATLHGTVVAPIAGHLSAARVLRLRARLTGTVDVRAAVEEEMFVLGYLLNDED